MDKCPCCCVPGEPRRYFRLTFATPPSVQQAVTLVCKESGTFSTAWLLLDALFGHDDGVEPLLSYLPAALFGGPVIELGRAWAPLTAPSLLLLRRRRRRRRQQRQRVRISAVCLGGQK
jgi:hypothetical protein